LPPEKTGEASSLINVARNLGGSIGISLATTIVARSTQVHQNYLVDHLVPSSSTYQNATAHAANSLTALGVPAATESYRRPRTARPFEDEDLLVKSSVQFGNDPQSAVTGARQQRSAVLQCVAAAVL
jgi:hypothetical protein